MKKLLSLVLALIMLCGTFSIGIGAQAFIDDDTFTLGNADGSDEAVNSQDLFLVKAYLLGNASAAEKITLQAADIEADGMINSTDSFYLKSALAGKLDLSKKENKHQLYRFCIGGVDIENFVIELPDFTSTETNAHYTATLMQKYIKEACGATLEIVCGPSDAEHKISIHEIPRFSEEGEKYANENYSYDVTNGCLNLYGTYRGNMYAAYEIFENYLGLRFFDSEFTFLYKNRYVDIPEGTSVFVKPALKFRHTGQNTGWQKEIYALPSRLNSSTMTPTATDDLTLGQFYGSQFVNAHSFDLYWRMATGTRPAEDDPNYPRPMDRYNQQYESGVQQNDLGWQPCATSESEYALMFSGMLDTIARMESWEGLPWHYNFKDENGEMTDYIKSGQATMSFSLCDNEIYCSCRNCRNKANGYTDRKTGIYYPPEGYSGLYIDIANRAALELQDYYPGLRVHSILYNHAIPATVRPNQYMVIYYCGQGCNNHYLGTTDCGECTGQIGRPNNNQLTNESLKEWGRFCDEAGAEMWFWYYGVTYAYYMVSLPCVYNIYYDYKYLYEVAGVEGINYEGGGKNYNYETLKAYLSMKMQWDPEMTFEEYIGHMKEYLYMYYGPGYEKIFEFIDMEQTAGDVCGTCFLSNFDRPGDMYSYEYIAENYEYMRQLLLDAKEMANRPEYRDRIDILLICFDFLGLSSVHTDWYTNGDEASRELYCERYDAMYNGIVSKNIVIFSDPATYSLPSEIVYDVNPMVQFYEFGSRRENVYP